MNVVVARPFSLLDSMLDALAPESSEQTRDVLM
jgi:hypothetical protein